MYVSLCTWDTARPMCAAHVTVRFNPTHSRSTQNVKYSYACLPVKLSVLELMFIYCIRGSNPLHWRLAHRNVSAVRIEPCEETMHKHCSKLVIHNLMRNDTGFYSCSHQKSKAHEVSTYVFVRGKTLQILVCFVIGIVIKWQLVTINHTIF